MEEKRANLIDAVKGIGIILVVFAHVYYEKTALIVIYSFHMPLFFLIAGAMFRQEKYPRFGPFLKKRVRRLLVPYVIYEALSICLLYTAERVYVGMFDIPKTEYVEFFRQILVSNWSCTHVNQPLWFLPCLFLVEVLYYFLCKLPRPAMGAACVLLVVCGWVLESGLLPFDNMLLPWSLDSGLFALGFYALGNLGWKPLRQAVVRIRESRGSKLRALALAMLCAAVWLPLALLNGKVTLGSKILNNGFLLYLTGILGTLMVFFLGIPLENSRFLGFCGRYSFEIMASHYIIRKFLVRPVYILLKGEGYNRKIFSETWLPFVAVFVLSLLYTALYTRIRSGGSAGKSSCVSMETERNLSCRKF